MLKVKPSSISCDQVSASLGHNVDTLLVGIVKQIRLKEVELANRNSYAR